MSILSYAKNWRHAHNSPQLVASHSLAYWKEWKHAKNSHVSATARSESMVGCRGWHNLPIGWYRCGVDASFFHNPDRIGSGAILRDAMGSFVVARASCISGCVKIEEGEAMGLHEALSWIKSMGLSNVVCEMDSKLVVDAMKTNKLDRSEFGELVASCKSMLQFGFLVKYVGRDANYLAHAVARVAKDFDFIFVWNEPPDFVAGLPVYHCSCP